MVNWDVDLSLDPRTTQRTESLLRRYVGTAVRGVFQLASDPLPLRRESPTFLHDVTDPYLPPLPVFKPSYQYGSPNATAIAAALSAQRAGSLSYAYLSLGYDTSLVDAVAASLVRSAPHVKLVGYRELIALAQQKHTGDMMRQRLRATAAELRGCARVHCACEDYCRGACFACGCDACTAATWSFPGGAALCTDPGPLGTGLLCAVDAISGAPTSSACCTPGGRHCTLPPGSCCEGGSCHTCPPPAARPALFQPLPREFDERTHTCTEAAG